MFRFYKKIFSLSKGEIIYIFFALNFKVFYFILFNSFGYKKILKISSKLISKNKFFENIDPRRAFKINKILRDFPLKSTCLQVSLCDKIMLSYIGINVDINAGLKINNESMEGHAWLTYKGNLIYDSKEEISSYKFTHRIE